MNCSKKHIIRVFSTWIFVIIMLSAILFWVRWLPLAIWQGNVEKKLVYIKPSGLVPTEIENDTRVIHHSCLFAGIYDIFAYSSGSFTDLDSEPALERQYGVSHIYELTTSKADYRDVVYFNKKIGLICAGVIYRNKGEWIKKINLYAGPEGVSQKPGKNLGKFLKPISGQQHMGDIVIYDKKLRRFFRIDFLEEKVVRGDKLNEDFNIVQFGRIEKNKRMLNFRWSPPMIDNKTPIREDMRAYDKGKYVLALLDSGEIVKFDRETLEYKGLAGQLVKVGMSGKAKDLLSYDVLPFYIGDEYKGLFTASVSRVGMETGIAVFDETGGNIKCERKDIFNEENKAVTAIVITVKYILENLQPVGFNLASFFTASTFEATAGAQALFILPNSVFAMFARDNGESIIARYVVLLVMVLPGVILAIILSIIARRNATVLGLSRRARFYWTIGIILFGISGYITYLLTRPKETLVTCQSCGKMRRPDEEKCHQCGGKWDEPALAEPLWRVL